jgi:hypothetical protein
MTIAVGPPPSTAAINVGEPPTGTPVFGAEYTVPAYWFAQ